MRWKLDYWNTGEWQAVEERLKGLNSYHPGKGKLFHAMDLVKFEDVRVCIIGQDPYTSSDLSTGVAFSIPATSTYIPPTLKNILEEYTRDLHYPFPTTGDLTPWCKQGVFLWNAIPSVGSTPLSHNWSEWEPLTKEIVEKLDATNNVVFALLGGAARSFNKCITNSPFIETSHPSPRGNLNSRVPFLGSRLFTTINAKLVAQGLPAIDWRL